MLLLARGYTVSKVYSASLSSEFGAMSEEELDDIWAKSKYKAAPSGNKKFC